MSEPTSNAALWVLGEEIPLQSGYYCGMLSWHLFCLCHLPSNIKALLNCQIRARENEIGTNWEA